MNQTTPTTTAQAIASILGATAHAVGRKQVDVKIDEQEKQEEPANQGRTPKRASKQYGPSRTITIRLSTGTYNTLKKRLAMVFLTTGQKITMSRYIGNLIAKDLAQYDLESFHEPQ